MAVAFDAATESVRTTADPHTFTHTPVGTPRGVLVSVVHGQAGGSNVATITYGGVSLTRVVSASDLVTEPGRAEWWFVGSGIPTGAQTVSADISLSGTEDPVMQLVCITLTASGNTSVVSSGILQNNQANPSLTMTVGGLTSMAFGALYGGGASPTNFTPNGACTTVHDHDFGSFYAEVIRQSSVSSSDFAIGGTAATDDVAYAAVSIAEASNVTIDLDTSNIVASAVAAPATPEGTDVTVGPSAAASTADGRVVVVSTPAGTTVAAPAALADAAPATPDGIDKAVGVLIAEATASCGAPVISGTTSGADTTISLSGIHAPATAAPATPDGVDLHVGPSAAAAAASVVAPTITLVGGNFTTVTATAAAAIAEIQEEDPFPWSEGQLPPGLEVSVSPSAAAADAGPVAPVPGIFLGLSTRATATATGGTTLVGRAIPATAAEATAAGNVPTDVGDAVAGADIAPPSAQSTASVTTPVVSVSINAPQATATSVGLPVVRHAGVDVVTALATAAGMLSEQSVLVGIPSAQATAAVGPTSFVATGSAYIFAALATALANPDRPRSIGIKDFVLLIPRPSEDSRMLVPAGSGNTLVLTPLEEQVE